MGKVIQEREHNKIQASPNPNPLMSSTGYSSDYYDDPMYRSYSDGNYKARKVDADAQYNGISGYIADNL